MRLKTFEELPKNVQRDIVLTLRGPESLVDLSPSDAFHRWLTYNGIIGYTFDIIAVWEILRKDNYVQSRS